MAPELQHHLQNVLAAIRAIKAGPSTAEIAAAPILDLWRPLLSHFGSPVLWGKVIDHPRLGTTMMTTSRLVAIDRERGWARSLGRWFRLGERYSDVQANPAQPNSLVAAQRDTINFEATGYIPLDDPARLDGILADFISQARKEAAAREIGGDDDRV